jgi:hypothetical protein
MSINMTFKRTEISISAEGTMVGIIQLVLRGTETKWHCSLHYCSAACSDNEITGLGEGGQKFWGCVVNNDYMSHRFQIKYLSMQKSMVMVS